MVGLSDLIENELSGLVVVFTCVPVRKSVLSLVERIVYQFEVSALYVSALVHSNDRLNHLFIVVEDESLVLGVSESLDRRVHF